MCVRDAEMIGDARDRWIARVTLGDSLPCLSRERRRLRIYLDRLALRCTRQDRSNRHRINIGVRCKSEGNALKSRREQFISSRAGDLADGVAERKTRDGEGRIKNPEPPASRSDRSGPAQKNEAALFELE